MAYLPALAVLQAGLLEPSIDLWECGGQLRAEGPRLAW